MVFIYRSFLVLVVLAITWFSYVKHVEGRDRTVRVQDLKDCFQRREFAPGLPPKAVHAHLWQAIALLHEAQQAERSLGWWRNKEISVSWYIGEAIKNLDANEEEASLISRAWENAYFEVQRQGALATEEGREQLKKGQAPVCTQGLFAGDPLVVGFQLSPILVPQVRNHPANFVLQPATVWALQQDVPDASTLGLVRQFHKAGLVPQSVLDDFTKRLAPPPAAAQEEKND